MYYLYFLENVVNSKLFSRSFGDGQLKEALKTLVHRSKFGKFSEEVSKSCLENLEERVGGSLVFPTTRNDEKNKKYLCQHWASNSHNQTKNEELFWRVNTILLVA